nr:contractile injection system tape measure protein [Pedobacter kyonggii]
MNKHLIQSQKLMLTVDNQQDWEKVQAEIGHFCKTRLPEIFNTIFDEFALNNTIRIDKLDIDLGDLSLDKLIQNIEEQIIIQIYGYFKNHNFNKLNAGVVLDKELGLFLENLEYHPETHNSGLSANSDNVVHDYESLAFYCQTGLKPWWLPSEIAFKPSEILLKRFNFDRNLFYQFIVTLKHNSNSYNRLIQLISKQSFFYQYHHFKTDIVILKYFEPNIKPNLFNVILKYWLDGLKQNNHIQDTEDFGLWLFSLVQHMPSLKPALVDCIELSIFTVQLKKEKLVLPRFNKLLAAVANSKALPQPELIIKEEVSKTVKVKQSKVLADASILIENAGLIILYPYFKNLFNVLHLLNANQFIDEMCRHKAIVYLHYLVYNEMPEDESRLIFNKILCGADPEVVIKLNEIAFTEEELSQSAELKATVIKHWTKLGSTSIEGLTQTFLIRNGSLIFREGNYNLHVERKGLDILLDTLPWSLSIIRLPWNNYLINLNW